MLTAGRDSTNLNDFALVAMLGLLGLRIFEATGTDIEALSEVHGHRVLRVHGKGDKVVLVPLAACGRRAPSTARRTDATDGPDPAQPHRQPDGPPLRHPSPSRPGRPPDPAARMHPHMLRHTYVTTMLDAGVDLRDVQIAARHADPRTTMRYDRARKNLDRHANYILAAYMASGT